MADFLTTKQLQDLLQIDRTTVYRMLKDGRLTGIKVGNQWRFDRDRVEAILSRRERSATSSPSAPDILPAGCLQAIQNVLAELGGVAALTTAPGGEPLTELSNSCRFCQMILASESGRRACRRTWRKLAEQPALRPGFAACHAGLRYAWSRIEVNHRPQAVLIAGQYYLERPNPAEEQARLERLGREHTLDAAALAEAAREVPVLDSYKRNNIAAWLQKVAHTIGQIGEERADLIGRLRHIGQMSRYDSV